MGPSSSVLWRPHSILNALYPHSSNEQQMILVSWFLPIKSLTMSTGYKVNCYPKLWREKQMRPLDKWSVILSTSSYIFKISFNILMTDTDKTLITSNLNHSHRCWIVPIKATKWIFFDFVQKIKHKTSIKEFIFTWQMVEIVDNAQHTHKKTTTTTTMTVFRSQWWMCVI